MTPRTWLITGVSSGFGRELSSQLLDRGDRVIGTVRDTSKIADLTGRYPDTFIPEVLEMTDHSAVRQPEWMLCAAKAADAHDRMHATTHGHVRLARWLI